MRGSSPRPALGGALLPKLSEGLPLDGPLPCLPGALGEDGPLA